MLGQRAGSPIAEYARVQRPEPKTGQPKVQLYCKDDSLCPSCYITYLSMGAGVSQMVYNIMFLDNSMPVNYKTTCSRQMVNGPRSVPFSWYEYTYMRMCLFINRINNKN